MIERDVNHPSIIWWSYGNEKGWNTELDGEFHKYDPQKRPVIHPQGNFSGFETMHYRSYGESQNYMRLPEIFMPTEFLHGLYDGGTVISEMDTVMAARVEYLYPVALI